MADGDLKVDNATIAAFGARIAMGENPRSLCFVIGHNDSLAAAVTEAGGSIVTPLGPRRLLAIVEIGALPRLQRHPGVRMAAPVTIDAARFSRFAGLLASRG